MLRHRCRRRRCLRLHFSSVTASMLTTAITLLRIASHKIYSLLRLTMPHHTGWAKCFIWIWIRRRRNAFSSVSKQCSKHASASLQQNARVNGKWERESGASVTRRTEKMLEVFVVSLENHIRMMCALARLCYPFDLTSEKLYFFYGGINV